MAGLHIFWIILGFGLTKKSGACTLVGVLKALVELFTGGKLGVFVLLLSGTQGVIADIVFLIVRKKNVYTFAAAGGIATAANVVIFQLFFVPYSAVHLLLFIVVIAFISGVAFAGVFAYNALAVLEGKEQEYSIKKVSTLVLCGALLVGGVYYYSFVYKTSEKIEVGGAVKAPYSFFYEDFSSYETTVTAEMVGQCKYEPETEYTGVPLKVILEKADPEGTTIKITAEDGYTVEFDIENIDDLIITKERLLIAKGYDGGYWVQDIVEITVL